MSRTIRNYPSDVSLFEKKGFVGDGLRMPKFLKDATEYTGWVGEESWNRKTKKLNKRRVEKRNRHYYNNIDHVNE